MPLHCLWLHARVGCGCSIHTGVGLISVLPAASTCPGSLVFACCVVWLSGADDAPAQDSGLLLPGTPFPFSDPALLVVAPWRRPFAVLRLLLMPCAPGPAPWSHVVSQHSTPSLVNLCNAQIGTTLAFGLDMPWPTVYRCVLLSVLRRILCLTVSCVSARA